jgi:LemA protein
MTVALVVLGLILLAALAAGLSVVRARHRLVAARDQVDASWADIDARLRRRHDLVPSLVSTVKGYAAHEGVPLEQLLAARTAARAARGPAAQGGAESRLSAAIAPVLALAERNPQLRAADGFTRLRDELTQLEDEIQAARRLYNGEVQAYAARTRSFPSSLVAARGPFPPKELFPLEPPAAPGGPVTP